MFISLCLHLSNFFCNFQYISLKYFPEYSFCICIHIEFIYLTSWTPFGFHFPIFRYSETLSTFKFISDRMVHIMCVCVINSFQGFQCRYFSRKIPRYQMSNQKLQFEEEQTIQAMVDRKQQIAKEREF